MDSLKDEDKKNLLGELMKRYEFKKEEYYSNNENKKNYILWSLNEKGVLNVKHNSIIEFTWDKIIEYLENKP